MRDAIALLERVSIELAGKGATLTLAELDRAAVATRRLEVWLLAEVGTRERQIDKERAIDRARHVARA